MDRCLMFFCNYSVLMYYYFHPSILFHLSGARARWQQAKQSIPDVPLPSSVFQFLQEDPEAFCYQLAVPVKPPKEGTQEASVTVFYIKFMLIANVSMVHAWITK